MTVRIGYAAASVVLVAGVGACEDGTGPQQGAPAAVEVVAGAGQVGPVAEPLPVPVRVRVVDARGRPLPQQAVQFQVLGGGGKVTPAVAETDPQGIAETVWTLGTHVGAPQTLQAIAARQDTGVVASPLIPATAVAGPVWRLVIVGGDAQNGTAGAALRDSLAVGLRDVYGNPVAGAAVQWSVTSGGGSVSPATSVTDSAGVARTAWTLGTTLPAAIRASAGASGVVFSATMGNILLDVTSPRPGAVVGDEVQVLARVASSAHSIVRFTASMEDRSAAITSGGTWLNVKSLASGPRQLRVTAVDVTGDSAVWLVPVVLDRRPTVSVSAPVRGFVSGGELPVDAACTDDFECTVKVKVVGGDSAAAPGRVVGTIPVAALNGRRVSVRVTATDSRGQESVPVQREVFVAVAPRWTELASGGMQVWDVDAARLLFVDSGAVKLRDLASEAETMLTPYRPHWLPRWPRGFLYPGGAIFVSGYTDLVADWRGGPEVYHPRAYELYVNGRWAVWSTGEALVRKDLYTGSAPTVSSSTVAVNWAGDEGVNRGRVAANGDVVYWEGPSWPHPAGVYRYRGGEATRIAVDSGAVDRFSPKTDGVNVVWARGTGAHGTGGTVTHLLYDPAGEISVLYGGDGGHALAGGWAAYGVRDAGGVPQVWVRAPDGTRTQVTRHGIASYVVAVSESGRVVIQRGGSLYVDGPPYGAQVEVGPSLGHELRVEWRGDDLLVFLGRSVFRVNY